MKLAAVILALALGGAAIPGCQAQPPFAKFEKYTGRLEMPNGTVCSGTRFNTAIITSRHCLEGEGKQVRFQGILANITRVWIHGENIYVYTDRNWGRPPRFAKPPRKGEPLYLIGNAGGFNQIARVATLSATSDKVLDGVSVLLITCSNCWHGDSGAGIFNAKGELVAVYLGGYSYAMREASGTISIFALGIGVPL